MMIDIQIRAVEGGADARDLVNVMRDTYLKVCSLHCL